MLNFLALALFMLLSTGSSTPVENLSEAEQKSVFAAKNIIEKVRHSRTFLKPLLCATFTSLISTKSINNQLENIRFANNRCQKKGAEIQERSSSKLFKESVDQIAIATNTFVSVLDYHN